MSSFLLPEDIASIEKLAKTGVSESIVKRAQLLLLLNAGKSSREVGLIVKLSPSTVNRWRREYRQRGMAIFTAAQPNKKPVVHKETTPSKKRKKKPMSSNKKRSKRISNAIQIATAVAKSSNKKLGKIKKSKTYKKAISRFAEEKTATLKLLKRIKKGKNPAGIKKQLKRLEASVSILKKMRKKGKRK